jgi:hypothetical protein
MHDHHVDVAARRHLSSTGTANDEQADTLLATEDVVVQLDQPRVDRPGPRLAPSPTEEGLVGEQAFAFGEYH